VSDTSQPRPFNEQAALAELERLADKIRASRQQRERVEREFESFVRTFRYDRYTELINEHETALTGSTTAHGAVARPAQPPHPDDRAVRTGAVKAGRGARWKLPIEKLALLAGGVVGVLLLAAWLLRGAGQPPLQTQPRPEAQPLPAPAPAPAPARVVPPATAGTSSSTRRALNIELTTVRPVWIRVTVDGQKVHEREFPKGQTIPIAADRTILIRAGDGGAVHLTQDGKTLGPLARDGQIATKFIRAANPEGR
jgi:RodZ C-terminal domain